MDDELKQLEAELRRMRPAAPPAELVRRIERELALPVAPQPPAAVRWIWAVGVPAAAAITMWMAPAPHPAGDGVAGSGGATPATDLAFKPVSAENVLVTAQDEGLVTLQDGTTARRERLKYVDTITWKNPRTNASLIWTVPREEVRVVPVVFQ